MHQVDAQVVVQVVGGAVQRGSRQAVSRGPVEGRRKEQVVLLLETVHSSVEDQVELLLVGPPELERRIHRAQDAPDAFVVLHQRRRLQRVVAVADEWIGRVRSVGAPAQVVEVRNERQDDIEGRIAVVVVRDAARRDGVDEVGVHVHSPDVAQILADVQADRLLVVTGVGDDSRIVLPRPGDVVAQAALPAARHAEDALAGEVVTAGEIGVVIVGHARFEEGAGLLSEYGHGIVDVREGARPQLLGETGHADSLREFDARRTQLALFGVDDDDAIGGL